MKVRIIPHLRDRASWNLALEEALYLRAVDNFKKGIEVQPVVRLYSFSRPSVVLGNRQRISEIDYLYCAEHGIDVTMRKTGGGSVYLGTKELQYSLLLPELYTKELLRDINQSIVHSLEDIGFSPSLTKKTGHDLVMMDGREFVFDAQRRYGFRKSVLLHHGTTLIGDPDFEQMKYSLRASPHHLDILQNGNLWLQQKGEIREQELIRAFEKNLPVDSSVVKKDFTHEEIYLAKKLHREFYTNVDEYSNGKKKYGICYLTDSPYEMDQYAEIDPMEVLAWRK
jgi:lipoate-protein ligase A